MLSFGRRAVPEAPQSAEKSFQVLKAQVHRRVVETADLSELANWSSERLLREVRGLTDRLAPELAPQLTESERERLTREVIDEAFGLGPLEPLLADPTISDILVNGPDKVYVERSGVLEASPILFADNDHLMRVIQRIAARVGRRIDESSPMVDARLPDGSRVNAVVPPLALDGPTLSIRRFGIRLGHEDMLRNSTFTPELLQLFQAAVAARVSIVISGGAGSGKTTLLNTLSKFIPAEERLVTIEDTAELQLQQPHVVRMETRPANLEGMGEVTQRHLVRNSLRMRPDRVILGEVRGAEALDLLQAMNTGHEGSLTTIHANDTRDALARMEMMVAMAGLDLTVSAVRQYIASAVTLVIHVSRLKGGARRVVRVSEIAGRRKRRYVVRDLFAFEQTGVTAGKAVGTFKALGVLPRFLPRLKAAGLPLPEDLFAERNLAVIGR